MNAFAKMKMGPYWVVSGTPEFLVRLLEADDCTLQEIAPVEIDAFWLQSGSVLTDDLILILYQTGYLTIKEFDPRFKTFLLDYPNEEVRTGIWLVDADFDTHTRRLSGYVTETITLSGRR